VPQNVSFSCWTETRKCILLRLLFIRYHYVYLCFSHHWQHTTSVGSCRSGLGFWYQSCGGLCQDHKSQPLDQILIQFTEPFIRTTSLCKINFNAAFATPRLFSKRLPNALQAVSTKIKRIVLSLVWTTHNTRAWSVVKGDHISKFDTNRRQRLLQYRWIVLIAKYNLRNTWIWFLCDWH
jgi:hypothetical protein